MLALIQMNGCRLLKKPNEFRVSYVDIEIDEAILEKKYSFETHYSQETFAFPITIDSTNPRKANHSKLKNFVKTKGPILFPAKRQEKLAPIGAASLFTSFVFYVLSEYIIWGWVFFLLEILTLLLLVGGILMIIIGFIKIIRHPMSFKNKFWNHLLFWSLLLIPAGIIAYFTIFSLLVR
ncbi:MAG: hypothetical protein Q8K70_02350 [Bacteroidota bacterium]|nr:hypothetical protein [Bacteroidota bacterium]